MFYSILKSYCVIANYCNLIHLDADVVVDDSVDDVVHVDAHDDDELDSDSDDVDEDEHVG